MENTICLIPGLYSLPTPDAFPNSSYSGAKCAYIGLVESLASSIDYVSLILSTNLSNMQIYLHQINFKHLARAKIDKPGGLTWCRGGKEQGCGESFREERII